MLKKLIIILILPIILLTSCQKEQDNKDIFKLKLSTSSIVEVYKNITIIDGEITSQYLTYTSNLLDIEYTKDIKFSGPSTYDYLIKLEDDTKLYIIDNTTFVYNNYKCNLVNASFEFLNNLTYYQDDDLLNLKLDSSIQELKIFKSTNETFYLKTQEKISIFTNKMNNLLLVPTNEQLVANLTYEITYGTNTLKIINHQYILFNDTLYKIVKGTTLFLDEYTKNNTDSNSQSSGWLPWV